MKKMAILLIALMVVSVGLLSGCTNEETSGEISITSFGVEPTQIQQGETANLTWVVVGATSVTIDNGIGDVVLEGSRIILPTETTTYTLTATDGKTTKTATAQIIVEETPDERFFGNWTLDSWQLNGQNMSNPGITWTPRTNGTYELTYSWSTQIGTWEIKDGKFHDTTPGGDMPFSLCSWSYQFSDGDNTLTMSGSFSSQNQNYSANYVFKKL